MKRGNINDLLNIWYFNELNFKNSIINYLEHYNCDKDVSIAGYRLLGNINHTLKDVISFKKNIGGF